MFRKGISILEILMVMSILSILTIIFVNNLYLPRQFARVNNLERESDVKAIQIAINQYRIDNNGQFPLGITNSPLMICTPGCVEDSSKIDILNDILSYIDSGEIPIDPTEEDSEITGYTVYVDSGGNVIVTAENAENNVIIKTE